MNKFDKGQTVQHLETKGVYETRNYFYNETNEKYYMQYISHIFVSNGIYRKECDDVMREVYYYEFI